MALVEFFATKQKMAKESGDVTRWHWKNQVKTLTIYGNY